MPYRNAEILDDIAYLCTRLYPDMPDVIYFIYVFTSYERTTFCPSRCTRRYRDYMPRHFHWCYDGYWYPVARVREQLDIKIPHKEIEALFVKRLERIARESRDVSHSLARYLVAESFLPVLFFLIYVEIKTSSLGRRVRM